MLLQTTSVTDTSIQYVYSVVRHEPLTSVFNQACEWPSPVGNQYRQTVTTNSTRWVVNKIHGSFNLTHLIAPGSHTYHWLNNITAVDRKPVVLYIKVTWYAGKTPVDNVTFWICIFGGVSLRWTRFITPSHYLDATWALWRPKSLMNTAICSNNRGSSLLTTWVQTNISFNIQSQHLRLTTKNTKAPHYRHFVSGNQR